jgi:hypothetical protein
MSDETDQAPAAPAPAPTSRRAVRTPGQAPAAPAALQVVAESEDMPNAIDIDAKTIKGSVLTRQGWVCPDESGREPRGPR